jgi:putative RNA 2'-phosphotransferase
VRSAGPDPVATSKFLSYVLRHHPEAVGLELDPAGWVAIDVLLAALAGHGRPLHRSELDRLVAEAPKRRFEVHSGRIRAAQGHSVEVDLQLPPTAPPPVLFHGTVARAVDSIRTGGLVRGQRRFVHLSADRETAAEVGARRGRPVVLRIDAAGLHAAGSAFYRASNGVWLTLHVPAGWISEWPT